MQYADFLPLYGLCMLRNYDWNLIIFSSFVSNNSVISQQKYSAMAFLSVQGFDLFEWLSYNKWKPITLF